MGFFKNLFSGLLRNSPKPLNGFRHEGDGLTPETAFRLIPENPTEMIMEFMELFEREARKDSGLPELTKGELRWRSAKLAGETCKNAFCESSLGRAGKDFQFGEAQYFPGTSIHAQEIIVKARKPFTVYFDFTFFGISF